MSCQEPKLKSEIEDRRDLLEESAPEEVTDPVERKRRAVVGRTFAALTLGARKFTDAEVIAITDEAIVVRHSGGEVSVPWSEVPAEVREEWGFDPPAAEGGGFVGKIIAKLAPEKEPDQAKVSESPPAAETAAPDAPELDLQERAREIARIEQMLAAQMEGIRVLESDFSRHSLSLQNLQVQLQSVRARQAGAGKGGVRVERIGGESTIVDRRKEAAELEAKIRVEEPLVAQLSASLQKARTEFQRLQRELAALRYR